MELVVTKIIAIYISHIGSDWMKLKIIALIRHVLYRTRNTIAAA